MLLHAMTPTLSWNKTATTKQNRALPSDLLPISLALLIASVSGPAAAISPVIHSTSRRSTYGPCGCASFEGFSIRGGASESSNVSAPSSNGIINEKQPFHFSLYQPGDGSDDDPDRIPKRYLSMQKGNRPAAMAALNATLNWRQRDNIDTLLQRPHANFDIYKAVSAHFFLGRDATGHVALLQRPALDSGALLRLAKTNPCLNIQEMVLHYAYVLEYLWNVLDPPDPNNGDNNIRSMTSIIDLTGLDLSIMRQRELLSFVKQFVRMTSTHYPQRSYKTLVVNAPSWFQQIYRIISPLLRESTKEKILILRRSHHQVEVLREVLGGDMLQYLPPDLLTTDHDLYQQSSNNGHDNASGATHASPPMEQELRAFVHARLQEAGVEMNSLATA
jgi:CRAL/TRIO domain